MQDASNDNKFSPKSFLIICIDENGDIGLEMSWGETIEDVKKFAKMLDGCVNGKFNSVILNNLEEQSKAVKNGTKKYNVFKKEFHHKIKDDSGLVINPTMVEL